MSGADELKTLRERAAAAALNASAEQKERALIEATAYVERTFNFRGERLTTTQALSWPRRDAIRNDGTSAEGVPDEVKEATALLAGFILAEVGITPESLAHLLLLLDPVLVAEQPFLEAPILN